MKPIIQKLPLSEDTSFVCRTYRTPQFESPWHRHQEHELLLITESHGNALIGSYIGDYQVGDVFLLGSNLPHWFRKADAETVGSAIVIHFEQAFMGMSFWELPEMRLANELLTQAGQGIKLSRSLAKKIGAYIRRMETSKGYDYLKLLLDCLNEITKSADYQVLIGVSENMPKDEKGLIGQIYEYTFQHFQHPVAVKEVAAFATMSLSTFGRFFKQSTKKPYSQFLKEVRIAHACKLLLETQFTVASVCYECGYNNWANFNRHFRKLKGASPMEYRKKFRVG